MTEPSDPHNSVVIERIFEAPAELIWQMWTVPDLFAQWYGPDSATIPVAKMDIRVGGRRLVRMDVQTPDGAMSMWFTGRYLEVVENARLVYTESIADENGNVLPPSQIGMPDDHPTTTEVHVQLQAIGGRTKMVLTHVGIPEGSPGASGWTMAFDKLTALISTCRALSAGGVCLGLKGKGAHGGLGAPR
jgi:uncharacterized protein YndB with AHSA1/START domain